MCAIVVIRLMIVSICAFDFFLGHRSSVAVQHSLDMLQIIADSVLQLADKHLDSFYPFLSSDRLGKHIGEPSQEVDIVVIVADLDRAIDLQHPIGNTRDVADHNVDCRDYPMFAIEAGEGPIRCHDKYLG